MTWDGKTIFWATNIFCEISEKILLSWNFQKILPPQEVYMGDLIVYKNRTDIDWKIFLQAALLLKKVYKLFKINSIICNFWAKNIVVFFLEMIKISKLQVYLFVKFLGKIINTLIGFENLYIFSDLNKNKNC